MNDPSVPVQKAAITAIRSKLTTAGYSSPSSRVLFDPKPGETMPYIVIGGETVVAWPTKTTEGADVVLSYTAWATTYEAAATIADWAIRALTDRDSPLTPVGFDTSTTDLEFRGSALRNEIPAATGNRSYFGVPFSVRIRVIQQ